MKVWFSIQKNELVISMEGSLAVDGNPWVNIIKGKHIWRNFAIFKLEMEKEFYSGIIAGLSPWKQIFLYRTGNNVQKNYCCDSSFISLKHKIMKYSR